MRTARALASLLGFIAIVGIVGFAALIVRTTPTPFHVGAVGSPAPPPQEIAQTPPASIGLGLACGRFVLDGLRYNHNAEQWTSMSDAVVIATVGSVGLGEWATTDGKPPSLQQGERPTALDVYHKVTIHVTEIGKTSSRDDLVADNEVVVRVVGGTVGCRSFVMSGAADLRPGAQVALFLSKTPQPNLASSSFDGFDVIEAWPVSKGFAHGPLGDMSIDRLLDGATSAR